MRIPKTKHIIISIFWLFSFCLSSQNPLKNQLKYLNYIFPADSLNGFDEIAASQLALQRYFFGKEYKVFMYKMKRDFINTKYGYSPAPSFGGTPHNGNNHNPGPNALMGLPCNNEGFESSANSTSTVVGVGTVGNTLLGWTVTQGQNAGINGSCTMAGCCPTIGSTNAWVRQTPWTDPNAGLLGVIGASPLGGTKILQMNDNIPVTGEMVEIQQTFPVTANNALFRLAYLASLNGQSHLCCDQPFLKIQMVDCLNNVLACPSLSVTPPGASCVATIPTGWATTTSGISYTTAWQNYSLDLTPYLGSCVTIKIIVSDCDGWAHHGMCYVDMLCAPMTITVNNVLFPVGPPVVAVTACGVLTASMTAPPGLGPYLWNGPAGSGITNNANQTVTTTVAGNYTLSMSPPGICAPLTKTISLTFGTFPTAGFTRVNTCTTYTLTNTGTPAPSVQSYSFVGAGAPPSYTTTNPTSVVIFAPSTTYTIYQTVTNPAGCPMTFTTVITTPAGPNPAFTAVPSMTQCINGNSFTFNAAVAAGTHTYNFSPAAGAPPSGFVANYGAVAFLTPGTYTVTHTINNGAGCISATSSVVTISASPTITATGVAPGCTGGTASLTGTGGPGVVTWAGPNTYTALGGTQTITNFQIVNQGIYTLTANNNGCVATKTVNMVMGSQPNATLTNTGPYCQGATIIFNAVTSSTAISQTQFWGNPCCWSTCCSGLTATVTTTATTSSSGIYFFWVSFTNGCIAQVQTTVTVNVCALPVELSSFEAKCHSNAIEVDWSTASENNCDFFTIKKSADGIIYEPIAEVLGHGTSYQYNRYSFIDNSAEPDKIYYYNLTQTDFDRTQHSITNPVYASCERREHQIDVYPVPSANELFIVSNEDLNNVSLEIVDGLGQKVKQIANVSLQKNKKYTLNIQELNNGCFHLIISGSETLIQKRIITYR